MKSRVAGRVVAVQSSGEDSDGGRATAGASGQCGTVGVSIDAVGESCDDADYALGQTVGDITGSDSD